MLPYDSLIREGRYVGGHVIVLHSDDNTYLFAVPPEVVLPLKGMLSDQQCHKLVERTAGLTHATSR
ncbi:MAG: hypothetical protein M3281_05535 [Chloroflexota bacterium]|nr:hypothetical protein [Chloroflexota bacterium]